MIESKDLELLTSKGISPELVEKQISLFKSGIKPVVLDRPAIPGDGIEVFDEGGVLMYAGFFDINSTSFKKVKFIPSSGAASRMFKDLFTALEELRGQPHHEKEIVERNVNLKEFFNKIKDYAFYNELELVADKTGYLVEKLIENNKYSEILNLLLNEKGLNYGFKPKGVIKFHKYNESALTPVEEHILEASQYLVNTNKSLKLHFTVSPEHIPLFHEISERTIELYKIKGIELIVNYSIQEPSTDTVAVDLMNNPFRENNGSMHFRPGGHGALLLNLGKLDEDLIFISNIDNVSPDRNKPLRVLYKKFLGGYLLEKLNIIRQLLNNLENGLNPSIKSDVLYFIEDNMSKDIVKTLAEYPDENFVTEAFNILNKPVRVCGIVKNTGEPGGGPFWIKGMDRKLSKQIIESSQIDMEDSSQKEIFLSSTHFNPVDLVCCIRDYKGNKFHLEGFRDDDMAFIARKSAGGRELKALELPGLWNGSMAGWITFFVEVPIGTFSPVKTVFDLGRPEHKA